MRTRYLETQRKFIRNQLPMLGPLGVNFTDFGGSDHYYKGAWMLHTLRHVIDDDPLYFGMLRSFYQGHVRSIVSTDQVIDYFSDYSGRDLRPFFTQYLEHPAIPVLQLRDRGARVEYRLQADVTDLTMPLGLTEGKRGFRVGATREWQALPKKVRIDDIKVDESRFLVDLEIMEE